MDPHSRSESTVAQRRPRSLRAEDLPPWDPDAPTQTQRLEHVPVRRRRRSEEEDERLALFAAAADREGAEALLEGLVSGSRERALAHLRSVRAAPSSERQGHLSRAFGVRADAAERVRALWDEAGPELRRELHVRMPHWLRSLFPNFVAGLTPPEVSPALGAFAERLLREATR